MGDGWVVVRLICNTGRARTLDSDERANDEPAANENDSDCVRYCVHNLPCSFHAIGTGVC